MDSVNRLPSISKMENPNAKFVIVTGGTMSGIGKGTAISSMGVCLKAKGFNVSMVKIDPYLNIDAGTMSPFEHGECYVLADGTETDLDLGNYERFLNLKLNGKNIITAGRLYNDILKKEREGKYLGKTVQIVPHVTDHLESMLISVANTKYGSGLPDIVMVEVGGTVGDLESALFIESISRMRARLGRNACVVCHLGYVPVLYGEQKTKPTQASIRQLRLAGLEPDFVLCRCNDPVILESRNKIATHCNMSVERVISCHDVTNMYRVAPVLEESGLIRELLNIFHDLQPSTESEFSLADWSALAVKCDRNRDKVVKVLVAGKYTGQADTYLSVIKALNHAVLSLDAGLDVSWYNSDESDPAKVEAAVRAVDVVIIPGGFGNRGVEGKIEVAKYCRENKVPLLGICLGMQIMVIEYMRNVLGYRGADSEEFNPQAEKLAVVYMPETRDQEKMGGTMVLGERSSYMTDGLVKELYGGCDVINERHRHRYEINPKYVVELEAKGDITFTGKDRSGSRMHVLEFDTTRHPYYIGVQCHPELCSRPLVVSPVFKGLIQAGLSKKV